MIACFRSKISTENNAENLTERQTKRRGWTHLVLVSVTAHAGSKTTMGWLTKKENTKVRLSGRTGVPAANYPAASTNQIVTINIPPKKHKKQTNKKATLKANSGRLDFLTRYTIATERKTRRFWTKLSIELMSYVHWWWEIAAAINWSRLHPS